MKESDDNIIFSLDECEENNTEKTDFDINAIMQQFEHTDMNADLMVPHIIHYHENFTNKELLVICDYYGIGKELRSRKNKYNKDIIIQYLVEFESNPENNDIVFKRQNMWFYINELKNDKFMKKFLLW
jgi:hypothetical protein